MKGAFFLAIDIGTSSTRSAIYGARGERLLETTAQIAYPLMIGADGRAELRPEDLRRAVFGVLEKTFAAWRKKNGSRGATFAGIGVSCFWHSLLGLDAQGRPLTPIYTWADSRSQGAAAELRKKPGEAALHARTGCMVRASFWPAKLVWLKRTQPALFRRVARWVSPAEWIQEAWCGSANVSFAMASGTGLLDGRTLRWEGSLLRRCGIAPSKLNAISDAPGKISAAGARKFPELAGVPWFPAIGDGAASNLGSGATKPGVAAINVGTSGALRVVLEGTARGPLAPFGLFCYRVDAQRRLLGGAVSNAGNLRAWAVRELKLPDGAGEIEKRLAARPGPAERLTLLPFLLAERAPTWPDGVPSVITGLTQATTALDLLQALQESSYLRLAQIARAVEKAAGRKLGFIVSGGIQKSPESLRRLANVLGRAVYASPEPEASLRGAACFAMTKCGIAPAAPKLGPAIRPQAKVAREYARALERQVRLETWMRRVYAKERGGPFN